LIKGEKIPVYGTGKNVRDWLHVEDHCYGILSALAQNKWGETYNFGGHGETSNLDMAYMLLKILGKNESQISFIADRKGHDWRYAMDSSKAKKELSWTPRWTLDEGLAHMVEWFKKNKNWWNR
jgi:dTDP-glucose 4,6-dehydratase